MRVWFKTVLAIVVILVLPTLSGCATNANIPDGKPLTTDQGLLTFQINAGTSYVLDMVPAIEAPTLRDKIANPALELVVKPGLNYYVVPLKQGEYKISYINDLQYGRRGAYVSPGNWSSFSVYSGGITYIGLMTIQTQYYADRASLHFMVFNYGKSMKEYLRNNYPVDIKTMPYNHQLLHR